MRNWDYRYCWLRDASLTLRRCSSARLHRRGARVPRLAARARRPATPADLQIMYGIAGERRLDGVRARPWLPGYEGSRPVRVGNAASDQFQLDVYGEVLDAISQTRRTAGLPSALGVGWRPAWSVIDVPRDRLERPDDGIWEVRGGRRHFTHSKVMAWVAFDRAVRIDELERVGAPDPVDRWRALRDEIHAEVCERGFNAEAAPSPSTTASDTLDASVLLMPHRRLPARRTTRGSSARSRRSSRS